MKALTDEEGKPISKGRQLDFYTGAIGVDVSDFAGTGLEDDASENLRIAAAAAGDGLDGGGGSALSVDVTDIIDTNYGLTEDTNNIRINLAATSGLNFSSGALLVGAGDGIDVLTSTIAVDVTDENVPAQADAHGIFEYWLERAVIKDVMANCPMRYRAYPLKAIVPGQVKVSRCMSAAGEWRLVHAAIPFMR